MAKEPSETVLKTWRDDIKRNGVKRMRVRALLKLFGAERRGAAICQRIEAWGQQHGLHLNGFAHAESVDDVVSISDEEIVRVGNLVEHESDLMKRFEAEIAPQLDLLPPMEKGFEPQGCRDKLDFLCQDAKRHLVVVELKLAGGEKRGVEQVLRYMRFIRKDSRHPGRQIRGILVTGEGDLATRRALEELAAGDRIDWWIYGVHEGQIQLKREPVVQGGRSRTSRTANHEA